MNTSDRPEGPVPAWHPASPPALATPAAEVWDETPDIGPPPAKILNARVVWRAARRHWWQILVLWTVLSAGLLALAYTKIQTSYEATSWLIVRSSTPRIFEQSSNMMGDFNRYQRTQVDLVTSSDVLGDTLTRHPELAALPLLRGSEDPESDIRRLLRVQIRPDTNLITVGASSENKNEAVIIVDAVVEAYLKAANNWSSSESNDQIERLNEEARKLKIEIDGKKKKIKHLAQLLGNVDPTVLKDQGKMSLERFQQFLNVCDNARIRRMELESEWKRPGGLPGPRFPSRSSLSKSRRDFSNCRR
jgi:hypothetical protein